MRGPLTLNPWQRKLLPLLRMKVCHTSSLKNYLCIWLVSYVSILLDKLYNLKFYNIDNIKYMMHCCPHWNLNVSNTCMTLNDYFFFLDRWKIVTDTHLVHTKEYSQGEWFYSCLSRPVCGLCKNNGSQSEKGQASLYPLSITHSSVCSDTIPIYSEFNPCLELMTTLINI